jgi:hypothetical protein
MAAAFVLRNSFKSSSLALLLSTMRWAAMAPANAPARDPNRAVKKLELRPVPMASRTAQVSVENHLRQSAGGKDTGSVIAMSLVCDGIAMSEVM